VIDAEVDRAPQHGDGLVVVARRPHDAGSWELHRAEADAVHGEGAKGERVHALDISVAARADSLGQRSPPRMHHDSSCGGGGWSPVVFVTGELTAQFVLGHLRVSADASLLRPGHQLVAGVAFYIDSAEGFSLTRALGRGRLS